MALVESGAFLSEPEQTQTEIDAFLAALDQRHPDIAAITLSSTHLPWLRPFFAQARPDCAFFDPIEDAVAALTPHAVAGDGRILALVTENERYSAGDFQVMLERLGIDLPLHVVDTDPG